MIAKILTALVLTAIALTACTAPRGGELTPIPPSVSATPTVIDSDQVQVHIYASSFSPAAITIKAGATVTWTNKSETLHIVASDDSAWMSESLEQGQTYQHVFTEPGTYNYHCDVHWFMKGTIVVLP